MMNLNPFKIVLSICFIVALNTLVGGQNIKLDKELGAQNAQMVESQMGIYPHKEMNAYVEAIGQRLVAELDDPMFDYQFQIVDDPIPNAFALPGGYVYVTRGILSLITTEDELACVMAHEIIHVTRRHSIKQLRNSILPRMLELPGKIIGNVVNEDLGNLLTAPVETSNNLLLASYSRGHETESDQLGVELASKAGYDPNAMKGILDRLSGAIEILTQKEEEKSYFDDHPFTPDRLSNITKTTSKLNWSSSDKIASDFPQPINGLVFGENPSKGIFHENIFLHPELNFAITFPKGWDTENQPTSVNAMHQDRIAGIFVGLDNSKGTPESLGQKFVEKIAKEYKLKF